MTEIIRVAPRDIREGDVHVDTTGLEPKAIWTALADAVPRRDALGEQVLVRIRYADGDLLVREWRLAGLTLNYRLAILRA